MFFFFSHFQSVSKSVCSYLQSTSRIWSSIHHLTATSQVQVTIIFYFGLLLSFLIVSLLLALPPPPWVLASQQGDPVKYVRSFHSCPLVASLFNQNKGLVSNNDSLRPKQSAYPHYFSWLHTLLLSSSLYTAVTLASFLFLEHTGHAPFHRLLPLPGTLSPLGITWLIASPSLLKCHLT